MEVMQKIYSILMIFFFTACTHTSYQTVEIIGKNQYNATLVKGMGVRGTDGSILTSGHIVRDDRLDYRIEGEKYIVVKRDVSSDRAILSQRVVSGGYIDTIWQLKSISVGDPIYTEVIRNQKIIQMTGKVIDPSGTIVGYDTIGRTMILSGIVLTDLNLLPGDSGAPIFSTDRDILDIIHVR